MPADRTFLQELPALTAAAGGEGPGCRVCLRDAILSSHKGWTWTMYLTQSSSICCENLDLAHKDTEPDRRGEQGGVLTLAGPESARKLSDG